MNDPELDAIDAFLHERAQVTNRNYEACKLMHSLAYDFGWLIVPKFAEECGVSEDAVRQYFGGEPASEPEGADDHDDGDETEAAAQDAAQILSQQIDLLERDSNNILDSADHDFHTAWSNDEYGMVCQLNALNRQLNILTRMLAIHTRNTLKERED
ncbi:hypothetical protein [Bifidobacterium apri]|uniref:Uncharacterized protein n=1 Tax=Bifidobacterium apri TaxID=1769423 RepID=A0A6A2VG00_9BIFI|nr:hypothetical protein [Bifidobacterium apri]KAB8290644.1 hypothetical protein DSM100238_1857 [Bifidobacterium apri]